MTESSKNLAIQTRESWLKIGVISLFSLVIAYKFFRWSSATTMDFKFSDLLSMILAIFAIFLSVLFYFKATETSNAFYDNTYKFTKDISEILGRIEASFGERLRHLDEGYSALRDRPTDLIAPNISKTAKNVEAEEKAIKEKEEERDKLLNNLMMRAKIDNHEKQKIREELLEKEQALSESKKQLDFFKSRLERAERLDYALPRRSSFSKLRDQEIINNTPLKLLNSIQERLFKELGGNAVADLSRNGIRGRFNSIKEGISSSYIRELAEAGLLDDHGGLNENGVDLLRSMARANGQ